MSYYPCAMKSFVRHIPYSFESSRNDFQTNYKSLLRWRARHSTSLILSLDGENNSCNFPSFLNSEAKLKRNVDVINSTFTAVIRIVFLYIKQIQLTTKEKNYKSFKKYFSEQSAIDFLELAVRFGRSIIKRHRCRQISIYARIQMKEVLRRTYCNIVVYD